MSGPFDHPPFPRGKINGLLLIPKGASNVRLVTDFSQPAGKAFNDAVPPTFRKEYPLRMSTFEDVRSAIRLAGSGAFFVKHDLCDAYKFLRVCASQVCAQQFKFAGLYFYE